MAQLQYSAALGAINACADHQSLSDLDPAVVTPLLPSGESGELHPRIQSLAGDTVRKLTYR
jgi:hypothetical protein